MTFRGPRLLEGRPREQKMASDLPENRRKRDRTMLNRLARACLLVSLVSLAPALAINGAQAQQNKPKPAGNKPAAGAKPAAAGSAAPAGSGKAVTVDLDEGDPNANEIIVAPEAVAAPSKGTVVEAAPEPEKVFTVVEQQPEFPGGTAEMYKYLGKNIKYPSAASRANVSGRVFMSFVVNTDGSIQDVQVLKGLGFGCDEEAIRVVKAMPKWKPGKQSGRAVRVKYNLPINFQLE